MNYKTSELEGHLLDVAVAMALGIKGNLRDGRAGCYLIPFDTGPSEDPKFGDIFEPSTRQDHGGPIMERERIGTEFYRGAGDPLGYWAAVPKDEQGHELPHPDPKLHAEMASGWWPVTAHGPTPLIAGMRARVMMRYGDEVEIP